MPGAHCDRAWPLLSGWMCYGGFVPGTVVNLFAGYNGAPKTLASTIPQVGAARPRGSACAGRGSRAVGRAA